MANQNMFINHEKNTFPETGKGWIFTNKKSMNTWVHFYPETPPQIILTTKNRDIEKQTGENLCVI